MKKFVIVVMVAMVIILAGIYMDAYAEDKIVDGTAAVVNDNHVSNVTSGTISGVWKLNPQKDNDGYYPCEFFLDGDGIARSFTIRLTEDEFIELQMKALEEYKNQKKADEKAEIRKNRNWFQNAWDDVTFWD